MALCLFRRCVVRRWARVVLKQRVALLAVVGVLVGASVAVAGGSGAAVGKKYYACVTPVYRTINLSSAGASCPKGQRKISWNARGRRGLRGRRGVAGPQGATGATGAVG